LNSSHQDEVIDTKIGGFGGQNKAYKKKKKSFISLLLF